MQQYAEEIDNVAGGDTNMDSRSEN